MAKKAPKKPRNAAVPGKVLKQKLPAVTPEAGIPQIGGWLVVLVIVLSMGATLNLSTLAFNLQLLRDPTQSAVLLHHPGLHPVLLYEIWGLAVSIAATAYGIYLILTRKKLARLFITCLLLGLLLFTVQDIAWIYRVTGANPVALKEIDTGVISRAAIGAAVWIPYLWLSKRAARTLTEPFNVTHSHSQPE
jgi:hypothetical protein